MYDKLVLTSQNGYAADASSIRPNYNKLYMKIICIDFVTHFPYNGNNYKNESAQVML